MAIYRIRNGTFKVAWSLNEHVPRCLCQKKNCTVVQNFHFEWRKKKSRMNKGRKYCTMISCYQNVYIQFKNMKHFICESCNNLMCVFLYSSIKRICISIRIDILYEEECLEKWSKTMRFPDWYASVCNTDYCTTENAKSISLALFISKNVHWILYQARVIQT